MISKLMGGILLVLTGFSFSFINLREKIVRNSMEKDTVVYHADTLYLDYGLTRDYSVFKFPEVFCMGDTHVALLINPVKNVTRDTLDFWVVSGSYYLYMSFSKKLLLPGETGYIYCEIRNYPYVGKSDKSLHLMYKKVGEDNIQMNVTGRKVQWEVRD